MRARAIAMMVTRASAFLVWLLPCLLCSPGWASEPARDSLPNILLISLDTTRADYLTFLDSETAQRMSALSSKGTIFTHAISSTSWTLPAHVQMFTGTPPALHGVESDYETIDPLTPLLSEVLDEAGYFTAGVFTVRYLWGDYGFSRGFDVYRSALREDIYDREAQYAPRGEHALRRAQARNDDAKRAASFVNSPNVVALARNALEKARPDEPLFLFAHFFDPHADYLPPEPWNERFDEGYDGDLSMRGYTHNKRVFDASKVPSRQVDDRELEFIKSQYRGEVAWTDQWVGELLDLFELHGRLDDTLIIITGDHGEEFFEHGSSGHRRFLFDESIRVPLLIVPPRGLREGLVRSVGSQVSLSDILPTILDFVGLETPATSMGRSLRAAMYGTELDDRPELLSIFVPALEGTEEVADHLLQGVRTNDYKFLRYFAFAPDRPLELGAMMFDLKQDPEEQHPIPESDPRFDRAWTTLEDQLDVVRERIAQGPRTPDAERRTDVRETFMEELLALGYVQANDPTSGEAAAARPWGTLEHPARLERKKPRIDPYPAIVAVVLLACAGLAFFRIRARRA